ncbi:MAG: OmpH family outer membrane protein [Thermodesulfovibrionales bacterium]
MRKILLLTLCSVLLYVSPAGAAEALKIGFVDLPRIFSESDAGKKARADIEAIEKSKKAVIEEKVNALKKIEEEAAKQSSVLSAEAKKAKDEELEKLQRDIQRLVAEARTELQKKENELTNAILKDVSDIVDAIGYEEGYAVILRSEVVLSAKKELDLTGVVITRLNESKGKPKEEPKVKPKEKPKDKKSRNKD